MTPHVTFTLHRDRKEEKYWNLKEKGTISPVESDQIIELKKTIT
jgi:hypothetical protein